MTVPLTPQELEHMAELATFIDIAAEAERRRLEQELKSERFGAPVLLSEVRCRRCNGLLCKDTDDRWVHICSSLCTSPDPFSREQNA